MEWDLYKICTEEALTQVIWNFAGNTVTHARAKNLS